MARVECSVEKAEDIVGDDERVGKGVRVTCGECGETTESRGQSPRSVRRCLAMLREQCEHGENYYVAENAKDDEDEELDD